MATLQEIQARAEAMRNAKKMPVVDTTAVAPTPSPPVTPPTPNPITPPQTMAGVNGETFQVAPVNQATGLSQPQSDTQVATPPVQVEVAPTQPPVVAGIQTPTKVPEVAPTPIKTEKAPVVNYNTSVGREADVQKNLDSFVASGMDAEKLKTASGYNTATPEKRAMIEATIAKMNAPMDTESIYNAISTNAPLPDTIKNSTAYKNAQYTYNKVQSFKSMSPSQLTTAISIGSLLPGTPEYNKVMQDPAMANKIVDARVYAKQVDLEQAYKNRVTEMIPQYSKISEFLRDGIVSEDEINQITNTSAVVAQAKVGQEKQQALNAYNLEWNNAIEKAKLDFAGSPFLSSMIADINKGYKAKGDFLQNEITIATGALSTLKEEGMKMLDLNMENYKAYRDAQIDVNKTQATNAVNLQNDQAKFDQQIAQKAQAMNDPATAISTMVDEYKKLGIPFGRSTQEIIADYQANGGGNLAGYLSSLQKTIQGQDEYKAYLAKQNGTEWTATNITRYNPATGANESTPIFYRKKTSGGFEAVDLSGNPIDTNTLGGAFGGAPSSTGTPGNYATSTTAMRTDRNMNPTAMTTDVARSLGLVEGVDYVQGDSFKSGNGTLYTAKFIKDPIETTIRGIDQGGFTTKGGANRWTYTAGMGLTNEKWKQMTYDQKVEAVKQMYKHEGGNGTAIGQAPNTSATNTQYDQSDIKAFQSYDGKAIPEQYKTPADKKSFVDKYNQWASEQKTNNVKTGEDILNINLGDKTTADSKAALKYGSRMLNSVNAMLSLEDNFAKLPLKDQIYQANVPNILKSDNQKKLDQYKKDFATAVLRKESGASIAPSEFAGIETMYFAKPGDSQSVIQEKQNARNFGIKALLSEAGQDINGKNVSSYYNPTIIESQDTGSESIADRLARLRANKK